MNETILIVDDQRNMCSLLETDLRLRGYVTKTANSVDSAWPMILEGGIDLVVTDVRMPGRSGIELCALAGREQPGLPVIVMTAFGSVETAVDALRAGAYDFVTKPIEMDLLVAAIERGLTKRRLTEQLQQLAETVDSQAGFGEIIGQSPAMKRVYSQLTLVAQSDSSVLITGESGTGKELVARSIHRRSRRATGPFVAVNCSAIPEALLESEFFGHAKGAFTDARQSRAGLFSQAAGGTLFLDEIGDLPLLLQAKLLRALEERKIRPVGSDTELAVDVRLISATNRNLESAIESQAFREDLYYRINVIQIELPALRQRGSDILLLAQHYLKQFAQSNSKNILGLSSQAAEKLLAYPWPGNVRELRNIMERAVVLTTHAQIEIDDLSEKVRNHTARQLVFSDDDPTSLQSLDEVERRYILHVYSTCRNNRTQTAQVLGMDRKTLYRKLKQYGVDEEKD